MFQHLSIDQMREPPRTMFDAKLARQIAIRIMNVEMGLPRNRITKMMDRQRTSTSFAIQAVERRLTDGVFRKAYGRMARHALLLCEKRLEAVTD
ncbi:hypothetical protein OIU34_31240 [Pararhizobium sp. BT-229]|uniref:hypothetical protein n=1 Tax=Pararhizobium sp. BT-229 TaxID=2986923 RepID=UPI0021F78631|nr:hypothetical protein [Pararhizobium sp. BT-229]MCV9966351.1 hypothetical protein [Pararhizobium sp. BT-229]